MIYGKDGSIGRLYIHAGPWSCSHTYNTYIHTCTSHFSPTTQQHPLAWLLNNIVWLCYCLLISSWSSIQWRDISLNKQRFLIENSHIVSIIIHQPHPIGFNQWWLKLHVDDDCLGLVCSESINLLVFFNCCVCLQFFVVLFIVWSLLILLLLLCNL